MSVGIRTQKGFTLVEMLMYLAILVVASTVVVATFISMNSVFERNRVHREMAVSAGNVLDQFAREARLADSVNTSQSILNATSSRLVLIQGATTTSFYLATNTVTMVQNGLEQGPLTSSRLKVEELVFSHYINAFSEGVRISLTLSASSTVASTTQTFTTAAVLRGSYE